jgi:antirestriction protein ArdC
MDLYEKVTARIMEILETGTIPWKKPWRSSEGARNLITKKPYRGINQFLLNCSPYSSPYWLTFNQARQKGGSVNKGEKSTPVVFWKWINAVRIDDESNDPENKSKLTKVPLLRYYNVFNLDQIDGITAPVEEQSVNPFSPIEQAERVISNMPRRPRIQYGGDRACYSPTFDCIKLPNQEAFKSPEEFYSTAFHELAHATGHASRLSRKGILEPSYFGSHDYSQEELVAEFGSSMLCGFAGIEQQTIENSAAYIQGWLKVLKNDQKLAIVAAGQAQRAADFILDIQPTDNQQE